ncbi:TonB-dependent receptor [Aquabacterium sp. OR-4]|uniref:TonB-dependent receptor n=1 Tax=Aquabacterium sp. OR-4 TaxID=2978127 RepID=UPI0021B17BDD|nr:TonB-dependent receptor [Aquabacterium sp. OR-4]MDT7833952.1 TonB-dependent receptor [Aquabacterium sp. OR-4]
MSQRSFFRVTPVSRALAVLLTGAAASAFAQQAVNEADQPRAKDDNVRIGTVVITGQGDRLGAGQMLKEDVAKARSTVTKAATEKDRATGNPYQALALLPSINTFNHDATGLFGGGLSVRGFNSDQLGFTVNGVPVNDSGNFAVYPQEYIDQENVCTMSVAQGSPDSESPHAGATGGNVSISTCDPEDKRRVRVVQTVGGLNLSRTFVRFDTGRFADNRGKVFVSLSHSQADKWKGEGGAKRDHLDAAFRFDLDQDNVILGSFVYNRAVNNNIYNMTLAELNSKGYNYDFATTFKPRVAGVNGTAQVESVQASPIYYGMSLNPFENAIVSVSGSFKVAKDSYLKVQPYLWYGFGNGGWSERATSEATGLTGGAVDINGDGDTLDTVRVGRASVTRTRRPGVTAELNTTWGDHALKFGLWYERADHRQTQPITQINADGSPADIWLRDCIKRSSGACYQGRDWDTKSTAWQAYASDNMSFMGDRGMLTMSIRAPQVTRDVIAFASEGQGSIPTFRFEKDYNEVLPQVGVRFNVDRQQQVFANIAKNFKAPPNFAFTGTSVRNNNGVVTTIAEIKPETSVMLDLGYRLQTNQGSLSATVFNADFKNRQANSTDPNTLVSVYANAGRTSNRGLELEAGSAPFFGGFTVYGSLTLQKSQLKDDLPTATAAVAASGSTAAIPAKAVLLPTSGKQMTLTPEVMVGTALQYAAGPYYARLKLKHTGKQYATLMNDEETPAYTTGDLDFGYKFADMGMVKSPTLRLNISNIGNTKYRNPSSGTGANAVNYVVSGVGTVNGSAPTYYLGAPRLVTLSLSADFQ